MDLVYILQDELIGVAQDWILAGRKQRLDFIPRFWYYYQSG